jgi:hypothetical protein
MTSSLRPHFRMWAALRTRRALYVFLMLANALAAHTTFSFVRRRTQVRLLPLSLSFSLCS